MHQIASGYEEGWIVPIAREVLDFASQRNNHPSVYDKYKEDGFMKASVLIQEYCQRRRYVSLEELFFLL